MFIFKQINFYPFSIFIRRQQLESVEQFKYQGAIINDEGSHVGIISRSAKKRMPDSSKHGNLLLVFKPNQF